jgi:hypothetical protein
MRFIVSVVHSQFERENPLRKKTYLLLLFGSLFTIFYCENNTTAPSEPPAAVDFLHAPPDTSWNERGIDAVSEGYFIQLQWLLTAEPKLSHYAIYRSQNRIGPYQIIGTASSSDSLFLDGPLAVNIRFYYYIRAVADDGLSSEPSDTLDYMLLHKATGLLPAGIINDFDYTFSWQDPNLEAYYMLRLLDNVTGLPVWKALIASTYSGDRESVNYNFNGTAALDTLLKDHEYTFRIDVVSATENCGSESQWSVFKIL